MRISAHGIVEMAKMRDVIMATLVVALSFVLLLLGGCAKSNKYVDLQTVSLDDGQIQLQHTEGNDPPRLALVFGGGGVRGFAHLGVMKALAEEGITADIVTGSSVGAAAAALYASGMDYHEIEEAVMTVKPGDLTDVVISRKAKINGKALAKWINGLTGNKRIEELPVPLGVTVSDMNSGRSLLIVRGNLGQAVQASATIPGTCMPVETKDSLWVDGGLLALVPVRYARMLGADVVVAVDVMCGAPLPVKSDSAGMISSVFRLQSCKIAENEISEADYLIRPGFEKGSLKSFRNRQEAIAAGYQAGKAFAEIFNSASTK